MGILRFKDYLIDYLEYNNITNKDFANRIGITPKHFIDILSGEKDLSSSIIENISFVTDIPASYIYKVESNYKFEKNIVDYLDENNLSIAKYLQKYNYKDLVSKKWISFTDSSDKFEIAKDILKYLRIPSPEKIYDIGSKIFYKSKNDKLELLSLWLEKCYRETLKQTVTEYTANNIKDLVSFIQESALIGEFNEEKLMKEFNDKGIYLIIQADLSGSKIRGAFRVHRNKPAIYITYKHRRIADIYFALLHELAHCKTDYNKAKSTTLVSYEEDNYDEKIEANADTQAYDWMIDNEYYNYFVENKGKIENEKKHPRSFLVYRLARDEHIKYESSEYQKYNPLISN